eukprot:183493-Rhodomonas_salina.1
MLYSCWSPIRAAILEVFWLFSLAALLFMEAILTFGFLQSRVQYQLGLCFAFGVGGCAVDAGSADLGPEINDENSTIPVHLYRECRHADTISVHFAPSQMQCLPRICVFSLCFLALCLCFRASFAIPRTDSHSRSLLSSHLLCNDLYGRGISAYEHAMLCPEIGAMDANCRRERPHGGKLRILPTQAAATSGAMYSTKEFFIFSAPPQCVWVSAAMERWV